MPRRSWLSRLRTGSGGRRKEFKLANGLIAAGPVSRVLDIVSVIAFVFLLIAAVNYGNVYIALLSLTSLAMIWGGNKISVDERLIKQAKKETQNVPFWALIALGGFIMLDFVVPPAFGFLTAGTPFLSDVPIQQVLSIDVLIVVLNSDAEEDFFRQAITNLIGVRLKAGPWVAILGSGAIFSFAHFFVDAHDFVTLTIVFGIGVLIALAGIITKRLETCKIAHLANNLGALGLLAIFHPNPALMLAVALL
jgi:membrane protease YdiL (CAAX protease family)